LKLLVISASFSIILYRLSFLFLFHICVFFFYFFFFFFKQKTAYEIGLGIPAEPLFRSMFIPSTFKRPVSSWKALNLRKTLLMASSVRLKPLNCSRLPCVYAQETLTFLLTQKKTCVKNYVQKE